MGMMTFGVSFFYSGSNIGAMLFVFGLGAAISAVIVPVAAMILNPIGEMFLDSDFGQKLGSKAKFIFRIVFTIPGFGSGSQQTKTKVRRANQPPSNAV